MTKQELFDSTILTFFIDKEPFAIFRKNCSYRTPKGLKCAIGQHLSAENLDLLQENKHLTDLTARDVATIYPDMWKSAFGDLDAQFAMEIQRFHDCAADNRHNHMYNCKLARDIVFDHKLNPSIMEKVIEWEGMLKYD